MDTAVAAGWPTKVMIPGFMPNGVNGQPYDPFSSDGADHWYSVGAQRVRAISNDVAESTFRPGWLRSVSPGWINWAVESFMHEAAVKAGKEGVERVHIIDGREQGVADFEFQGVERQEVGRAASSGRASTYCRSSGLRHIQVGTLCRRGSSPR